MATNYQTMKQAGYSYLANLGNGEHLLKDNSTGNEEVFGCSKNFAGWAIIYKNTHLEFCSTSKRN